MYSQPTGTLNLTAKELNSDRLKTDQQVAPTRQAASLSDDGILYAAVWQFLDFGQFYLALSKRHFKGSKIRHMYSQLLFNMTAKEVNCDQLKPGHQVAPTRDKVWRVTSGGAYNSNDLVC